MHQAQSRVKIVLYQFLIENAVLCQKGVNYMGDIVLKLRNYRRRNHIEKFILILFLVLFLSASTIISVNMYFDLIDNQLTTIRYSVKNASEYYSQVFRGVDNISIALASTDSVSHWLYNPEDFDINNTFYKDNISTLEKEFKDYLSFNSLLQISYNDCVTIYINDSPIKHIYTKYVGINNIIAETEYAYKCINKNKEVYIDDIAPLNGFSNFFHVRTLKNSVKSDERLTIVMAMNEIKIRRKLKNISNNEDYISYLVNEDNIVFSSNIQEEIGNKIDDIVNSIDDDKVRINNVRYCSIKTDIHETDFSLIYLVPYIEIHKYAISSFSWIIILVILILLIGVSVNTYYSMRNTTFINNLSSAMHEVKNNNYDVKMPKQGDNSLDQLSIEFDEMTSEIKGLIEQTYKSKLLMKEMEIRSLHQQMNPHFLFNVLLTIQLKAKMSGEECVCRMIHSLSSLLRGRIYGNKSLLVTIDQEIAYIEFYLYLQKQRFEDKLKYNIEMHPDILAYEIPRLSLEPIVENAVIHGVESVEQVVVINIKGEMIGDVLRFDIIDNGMGFNVEKVFKKTQGVGINNTDNRIKLMYGEEYGLEIESIPGKGTHVTMMIPIKERGLDI